MCKSCIRLTVCAALLQFLPLSASAFDDVDVPDAVQRTPADVGSSIEWEDRPTVVEHGVRGHHAPPRAMHPGNPYHVTPQYRHWHARSYYTPGWQPNYPMAPQAGAVMWYYPSMIYQPTYSFGYMDPWGGGGVYGGPAHNGVGGGGHIRHPYYSYRRPWYSHGHPVYNRNTTTVW